MGKTTFTLKRKTFTLLAGGSGIPINTMKGMYRAGLSNGTIKSGTSFTQWYRGTDASAVQNTLSAQRAGLRTPSGPANAGLGFGAKGSNIATGSTNSALNKYGKLDLEGGVKTIDNHPKPQKPNPTINNPKPETPKPQPQPPAEPKPQTPPPAPESPAPTNTTSAETTTDNSKKGWSKGKKWAVGLTGAAVVGTGYAAKKIDDAANGIS